MSNTIDSREFLDKIYDEQYDDLYSYVRLNLWDDYLAEEAVQETMLVALRRSDTFITHPNPIGWLYGVLRKIIKHMQSDYYIMQKRIVALDACAPEVLLKSYDIDPAILYDGIVSDEEFDMLVKLYIHGYTYKDLGEEMGLSTGLIGMRVQRIKEKFRKKYKE